MHVCMGLVFTVGLHGGMNLGRMFEDYENCFRYAFPQFLRRV